MSATQNKAQFYSALVWILAGVSLVIYSVLGLSNTAIPGVEQLVGSLSSVEGSYIFVAAFLAVFIEGLYFIGSFFPGTTLIIIITILSQVSGPAVFVGTIATIFVGWCLASVVNIFLAKTYQHKIAHLQEDTAYVVEDRLLTTWFPAFRANYEVAQIAEGGNALKVFLSSVRVKFFASLAAAIGLMVVPFFIDIHAISNEEGFTTVVVVALISFTVGAIKLRRYFATE